MRISSASLLAGAMIGARPTLVGVSGYFNDTGELIADCQLALPMDVRAGDLGILIWPRIGTSAATAPPYASSILLLDRLNSTPGSNWFLSVSRFRVSPAQMAAGAVVVPFASNVTAIGALFFRGARDAVVRDEPHYRSSGLNDGGVTFRQETPTRPASLAVAVVCSSGGNRSITWPAGWTGVLDEKNASAGPGRISARAAVRYVDGESPADVATFDGAADLHIATITCLVESA